jgi:hypothetical protein
VIAARQNLRGRVLWLMLGVSACWVVYVLGSNYNGCRNFGFGQVRGSPSALSDQSFRGTRPGVGVPLIAMNENERRDP